MLVMGGKWGEINGKFQGRFEKWDQLKVGVTGVEREREDVKRRSFEHQPVEFLQIRENGSQRPMGR